MLNVFQQSYYIPGTLAADHTIEFKAPFDMQLVHVSLGNSAATDGQVKIGNSADDDAYMVLKDIGDSNTPAEYDRDDFVGSQFPHISDGTVVVVTVDYDGSGGAAAANLAIVLTFTEG